jgi:hypothetical protein
MKSVFRRATIAALAFMVAGCFTEPKPLIDEFTWESVENQTDITEGVTVAAFFRDISFLGQVKTPTVCYSATSKLTVDGSNLTVNVDITPSGSTTCAQTPGGVRYTGVIRNLSSGTYHVRIVQNVSGVGTTEFNETVEL